MTVRIAGYMDNVGGGELNEYVGRRRMEGEILIDGADWGLGWRKEKV